MGKPALYEAACMDLPRSKILSLNIPKNLKTRELKFRPGDMPRFLNYKAPQSPPRHLRNTLLELRCGGVRTAAVHRCASARTLEAVVASCS